MQELIEKLSAILDALNDHYDSATNSTSLWMGEHIAALEAIIANPPEPTMQPALAIVAEAMARYNAKNVLVELKGASYFTEKKDQWGVMAEMELTGWQLAYGTSLADAIKNLSAKLDTMPKLCPTCGGRLDGPCDHKH